MAAGDPIPDAIVRAHARAYGHTYGPASWDAATHHIVTDPDFVRFESAAQDRILTRLLGPGAARWYSRRRPAVPDSTPWVAAPPPNATDLAAAVLGWSR